jgi:cytochrome c-type biogenesis protein CcmF
LTLTASMRVDRDGAPVGVLTAEQLSFRQRQEMSTDVGIRRVWNEDLYLILAAIDDPNGFLAGTNPRPMATFTVLVNPLVPWIWTGGLIMAFGTLVAMWPTGPGGGPPVERSSVGAGIRTARRERELVEV